MEDGVGWAVLLQQCHPNSAGSLVIARRVEHCFVVFFMLLANPQTGGNGQCVCMYVCMYVCIYIYINNQHCSTHNDNWCKLYVNPCLLQEKSYTLHLPHQGTEKKE